MVDDISPSGYATSILQRVDALRIFQMKLAVPLMFMICIQQHFITFKEKIPVIFGTASLARSTFPRLAGVNAASPPGLIFEDVKSEAEALRLLETDPHSEISDSDLALSIDRQWWKFAKAAILRGHKLNQDFSGTVRQKSKVLREELKQLEELLNKGHHEISVMPPSFQWAQSPDHVFLNIKFAYRWSSPGALVIEEEKFETTECCFMFSGIGKHSQSNKKYVLNLQLFDELDAKETKWSLASVGKVFVTLKKKQSSIWSRLTESKEKLPNSTLWMDMQLQYQEELDKFVKSKKAAEREAAKAAALLEEEAKKIVEGEAVEEPKDDAVEEVEDRTDTLAGDVEDRSDHISREEL